MQTKTRDRLHDLLKKAAPLNERQRHLGLSIKEIILEINKQPNERNKNIDKKTTRSRKRSSGLANLSSGLPSKKNKRV